VRLTHPILGTNSSGIHRPGLGGAPSLEARAFRAGSGGGGWTERETRSKLHAIFRTAHEAAAGRRVEWQGLEIDPRYRMRNQTIIEALEITPEEEREMKTLISDDERRRRDRQRKNPEMSRQEYEGRAADRRSQARRMAAEGVSRQQIARALGWSKRHVQRVLNHDTRGG
jgi:DNA-binding NarL/FixJ family response regulator